MYKNRKVIAIILAAGKGNRFDNSPYSYKQFACHNSTAMWVTTANKFQYNPKVDEICVVYPKDFGLRVTKQISDHQLTKVIYSCEGGNTRIESLYNGLKEIQAHNPDLSDDTIIIDHDADRPLVTNKTIDDGIKHCAQYGSAWPCRDIITIVLYNSREDRIQKSFGYKETCTPIFKIYGQVKEVFKNGVDSNYVSFIDMDLKNKPHFYETDSQSLFKITYPEDWDIFTAIQTSSKL